mmetsp:Transcript_98874/g.300090  ORF Transcript_98874/g.300090 Transcript_98874/m.300090 type:complete len:549 (-) Transcript_98874:65-1711(-)
MAPQARVQSPAPTARPSSAPAAPAAPQMKIREERYGDLVRRQSRPVGEWGGNFGTCFWTFFVPTCIYYWYGITVMHAGRLVIPGPRFWYDLIFTLPAGIAIRPVLGPTVVSYTWVICCAAGEILLPAKLVEGVMLKNGRRLLYPMNGLLCFFLAHVGLVLCCFFGVLAPHYAFLNMGALLTEAVLTSYAMALWLYVDYGLLWRRHVKDPEFEEDHGVFTVKEFFSDFWLGVVRNPRLFNGILKVPFDLKRFWNARPGLTVWVMFNFSYMAGMYYNCKLPSAYKTGESLFFGDHLGKSESLEKLFKDTDPAAFCDSTGSFANIGPVAIFISLAHWWYIFDYNAVEPAYLTTTDIRHDLFGFMLTYGDWGFLSRYYPISFMGFLAVQGGTASGFITSNYASVVVGVLMFAVGMVLFRISNIEKHLFRTHMNDGGEADKYRSPWSTRLFFGDKKVQYLKTKEGSLLLTSGFWGLARHFNYIGDLIMCLGWATACYSPGSPFPWVPLSYCVYFWIMDLHRAWRDESRCSIKYGEDWERYKEAVPYIILPGVI